MKFNKKEVQDKIELVIEKLMHLGGPENEAELADKGESIGFFKRDFGIQEWDWPQGVGLYGILKLMECTGDNRYEDFLYRWFKDNLAAGLGSRNINTTAPLLTLVDLTRRVEDKELEALCLDWAEWLMRCLPRTEEGGFQHVTSANGDRFGVRLNENELWIDTLFMTVLFLNKMGQRYSRREWVDESIRQVLLHIKYLYDKQSGLFYHGWSFNRRDNFGGVFWCRGNSWFTAGILEYLEAFEGSMNPGLKAVILDCFRAQVKALKALQAPSGLWHTVLTAEDSYEEVSGSAAIAAGILKGLKLGILDDEYLPCAQKAVRAIMSHIEPDGTVSQVSAGTGMGMDEAHYKRILIAPMAYGQSLTLLALVRALDFLV